MPTTLSVYVKRTYDRLGCVPPILLEDLSIVGDYEQRGVVCTVYKIPPEEWPDRVNVREFVIELSILTRRYQAIRMRGLTVGVSVAYDTLPSLNENPFAEKIFTVKKITEDYMVLLTNRRLCHPLWIKRA